MSLYVLDTSALLAYIENEAGATIVGRVILEAIDGRHTLLRFFIFRCANKGRSLPLNGCNSSKTFQ